MTWKACLDCGEPTPDRRCTDCQAELDRRIDQQRGNANHRGYGIAHQRHRDRLTKHVETGDVTCWRCGQPIAGPWDLGHDDQDRNQYAGPEHPECNRGRRRRGE